MPKIKLNKEECIGCGTCEALAPEFFKIETGGKAEFKGKKKVEGEIEYFEVDEKDMEKFKEVIDACPVQAIKEEKD